MGILCWLHRLHVSHCYNPKICVTWTSRGTEFTDLRRSLEALSPTPWVQIPTPFPPSNTWWTWYRDRGTESTCPWLFLSRTVWKNRPRWLLLGKRSWPLVPWQEAQSFDRGRRNGNQTLTWISRICKWYMLLVLRILAFTTFKRSGRVVGIPSVRVKLTHLSGKEVSVLSYFTIFSRIEDRPHRWKILPAFLKSKTPNILLLCFIQGTTPYSPSNSDVEVRTLLLTFKQ